MEIISELIYKRQETFLFINFLFLFTLFCLLSCFCATQKWEKIQFRKWKIKTPPKQTVKPLKSIWKLLYYLHFFPDAVNWSAKCLFSLSIVVMLIHNSPLQHTKYEVSIKANQIGSFLRIWSHLLKRLLIKIFIFCVLKRFIWYIL